MKKNASKKKINRVTIIIECEACRKLSPLANKLSNKLSKKLALISNFEKKHGISRYITTKHKENTQIKVSLQKYCKRCKGHVKFVEVSKKKAVNKTVLIEKKKNLKNMNENGSKTQKNIISKKIELDTPLLKDKVIAASFAQWLKDILNDFYLEMSTIVKFISEFIVVFLKALNFPSDSTIFKYPLAQHIYTASKWLFFMIFGNWILDELEAYYIENKGRSLKAEVKPIKYKYKLFITWFHQEVLQVGATVGRLLDKINTILLKVFVLALYGITGWTIVHLILLSILIVALLGITTVSLLQHLGYGILRSLVNLIGHLFGLDYVPNELLEKLDRERREEITRIVRPANYIFALSEDFFSEMARHLIDEATAGLKPEARINIHLKGLPHAVKMLDGMTKVLNQTVQFVNYMLFKRESLSPEMKHIFTALLKKNSPIVQNMLQTASSFNGLFQDLLSKSFIAQNRSVKDHVIRTVIYAWENRYINEELALEALLRLYRNKYISAVEFIFLYIFIFNGGGGPGGPSSMGMSVPSGLAFAKNHIIEPETLA